MYQLPPFSLKQWLKDAWIAIVLLFYLVLFVALGVTVAIRHKIRGDF